MDSDSTGLGRGNASKFTSDYSATGPLKAGQFEWEGSTRFLYIDI